MSRIELIREIETDYKLYKENGGELGIIAFTKRIIEVGDYK